MMPTPMPIVFLNLMIMPCTGLTTAYGRSLHSSRHVRTPIRLATAPTMMFDHNGACACLTHACQSNEPLMFNTSPADLLQLRWNCTVISFGDTFSIADISLGATTELSAVLERISTPGWTLFTTALVLAFGQAFESFTHAVRHRVPSSLVAVVEAILSEITTLGFMGLTVGTLQMSSADSPLGQLSQRFLGNPHELFELFENVDSSLFPITIAFVTACTVIMGTVTLQFETFRRSTQAELLQAKLTEDQEREACQGAGAVSTPEECAVARERSQSANGILLRSMAIPSTDGVRPSALSALNEFGRSAQERRAEFLRFRSRFIEQARADGFAIADDFQFGKYLARTAAEDLKTLVSIEPVQLAKVWMPLMVCELGLLAVSGGVDGDFLPSLFGLAQIPIATWSAWNYARLWSIKQALVPQLGVLHDVPPATGAPSAVIYKLLPPRYALLNGAFNAPTALDFLNVVERLFERPALSAHDRLFGPLGSGGADFYLSSMKLNLFSAVVSLAFFGGGGGAEMVDGLANLLTNICTAATMPVATSVVADTSAVAALLTGLTLLPSVGAVLLTPYTFLMFNWVTSVEGRRRTNIMESVLREQRAERFRVTLASLGALCTWADEVLDASTMQLPRRTQTDVDEAWARLVATTPPERLLDVRALFEAQDEDDSGTIGLEEVHRIVHQLGYEPTTATLATLFERMDISGDGEVNYIEFVTAIIAAPHEASHERMPVATDAEPKRSQGSRLFDFFDVDRSGAIDETEMLARLEALGFDSCGVTQLFAELTGGSERRITRIAFERYLAATSTGL